MNKYVFARGIKKGTLYFIAILLAVVTFFPLIVTLLSSFKTNEEILLGMFSWPKVWNFGNYPDAIRIADAGRAIINSLVVAVATLAVTIVIAMPAAYVIARKTYKYLKVVYILFMAGVMVPVHCTLVSVSRISSTLGMKNSYVFLVLIYTAFNLSQAIFLFTGYIQSLDKGLDEAARIDGSGDVQLLVRILTPVCKPIIATEAILVFIYGYSELIFSLILITDSSKYTVSRSMLNVTTNFTTNDGAEVAFVMLSVIPMLIIYLFLHEKVESGILAGAVKG